SRIFTYRVVVVRSPRPRRCRTPLQVDALVDQPRGVRVPDLVGVYRNGRLAPWTAEPPGFPGACRPP
ncbi:MAG TPA: hypothetical protein VJ370_12615, partial [Streptosporangiaceae bacterium]|nr:hypothetical protein [Streptosporangiaceae bacterium]